MQTDPVGYKDDINLYAYVGNDPTNMTDPSGMTGTNSTQGGCDPENGACETVVVIGYRTKPEHPEIKPAKWPRLSINDKINSFTECGTNRLTRNRGLTDKQRQCLLDELNHQKYAIGLAAVGFIPGERQGPAFLKMGASFTSALYHAANGNPGECVSSVFGFWLEAMEPAAAQSGKEIAEAPPLSRTVLLRTNWEALDAKIIKSL